MHLRNLFICAGLVFSSLVSQTSFASKAPAEKIKRLACRSPNAQAVLLMGGTKGDVRSPDEASALTEDLVNIGLFCVVVDENSHITGIEVIDGEKASGDHFMSVADFAARGFQNRRSFPLYGAVLMTDLRCPNCTSHQDVFPLRFAVLHSFNLLGESRSDFRTTSGLALRLNAQGRYEVLHQGKVVHVALLEAGTMGINTVRLSECVTAVDSCLKNPEGNIRTLTYVDLENERRVKVNVVSQ